MFFNSRVEELGVAIGKDAKIQRRADFGFGDSMLDTQTCSLKVFRTFSSIEIKN